MANPNPSGRRATAPSPTKPRLEYSYSGFQESQGSSDFPGTPLDNDLANLKQSIDGTIDALADVRRSDGALANAVVTYDSLDPSLKTKWQVGNAATQPVDPAKVFAGPAVGADALPTFRALAPTDLPRLDQGVSGAVLTSLYERAKGSPQFEDFGRVQKNIADLRSVVGPADRAQILVQGYWSSGGPGGGVFWWDAASVAADNGGTIFLPTGHSGAGRWKRIVDDEQPYNVCWFGAKGDNSTDDRAAIMATIDTAIPLGKIVSVPKGSFGVSSPIYLNGTNWATPVINGGLGKPVAGQQPFVRGFLGSSYGSFTSRIFALPGFSAPVGEAVVYGRNAGGITVRNLHVDANNVAECCIDISWVGSATGVPGAAAPACLNEFTGWFCEKATDDGIRVNQAADTLIQSISYRGGTADVGLQMELEGGGIWANNVHIYKGRVELSCQNARISDSVLLNGLKLTSSALNMVEISSCQLSTDPTSGYTVFSDTDVGSFGTFAALFTSCFFLGSDIYHKAYFAGRWSTGAKFVACHFELLNYFDTSGSNWTPLGGAGNVPVFSFEHCTFFCRGVTGPPLVLGDPLAIPMSIPGEVSVELSNIRRGDGIVLGRHDFPDDVRLPGSSATIGRLRLKNSFLWADANDFIRFTKGVTPSSDASGQILLPQHRGAGSPLGVFTPMYSGGQYYDTTADTVWWAYGSTNTDWVPFSDRGADMASASTVDLSQSTGDYIEITGTTTITSFGTMKAGVRKTLRFQNALIITHNATSLIIPGNQSITVAASNVAEVLSLGSGNWTMVGFSSLGANANLIAAGTVADARLPTTLATKTLTGATVQVTATDAISAAGTTQGAATALTTALNNVTSVTAASADGVRLPATAVGASVTVWNNHGTDTLNVYPATSSSINGLAVNLPIPITALTSKTFRAITATKWLTT
ncbi:MAG: glycosyl hydrolase family 28-related protein [Inquilinus sp.]|uniref:glycosyl hydrolase family 28-related protein n=1 Tax=Inquilinus sp. TaxID=1932117 RepID=UPI003F3DED3B